MNTRETGRGLGQGGGEKCVGGLTLSFHPQRKKQPHSSKGDIAEIRRQLFFGDRAAVLCLPGHYLIGKGPALLMKVKLAH